MITRWAFNAIMKLNRFKYDTKRVNFFKEYKCKKKMVQNRTVRIVRVGIYYDVVKQ